MLYEGGSTCPYAFSQPTHSRALVESLGNILATPTFHFNTPVLQYSSAPILHHSVASVTPELLQLLTPGRRAPLDGPFFQS
jgi:hypothetical protein